MRRAGLTLVLLSILLAWCAQKPAATSVPVEPSVILVTDENDVASLANDSFMMAAHQHDYWGGKDRLVVLDFTKGAGVLWFGGDWTFSFGPEDGVVVPHGTARVEVTVAWTD